MALDFPSNPVNGQVYDSYYYDSVMGTWRAQGSGLALNAFVNPTITGGTISGLSTDLAIADGGTGASTASAALTNLGLTATATELSYTGGVTSSIQTQLNGKAASSHVHSASDITSGALAVARGGTGATTGTGLVSVIPTSVTVGSGSGSVSSTGVVSFSGASSISINGAFTTTFRSFRVLGTRIYGSAATQLDFRYRASGSDRTSNTYYTAATYSYANGSGGYYGGFNGIAYTELIPVTVETGWSSFTMDIHQPAISDAHTSAYFNGSGYNTYIQSRQGSLVYNVVEAVDGFTLYPNSASNLSGFIQIYGYKI